MKVNTGCSFIHPVTGQMVHPGQTYEEPEIQKADDKKEVATKKAASSAKEKTGAAANDGKGTKADSTPAE
ncbi:hypothetical protein [Brevibacillus sp. HD3.3A]|uniref:hypothetical protein n=1 Tax=Brevibacillus sp. HD3.3A TaxID=2738979 RepID=UPI00156ADF9D|nr:hypothetical protein [Brevibacillus sp. HD3.3A]UED72149.1 hypothetical protein HP435_29020 [Brevibacillus sp. HD3.3A]